jgi:serine protease Do
MYDEDEKKDTGRMNPEEHKEEAVTTNFIMKDPDLEKSSAQDSESSSQPQPQTQTHSSYEAQQDIPHYQEYQYHRAAGQNVFQEEEMPKKKGGFAKKAAGFVGGALVFGVVAGSTMVGINWAAGAYGSKNPVEISQVETIPSSTSESGVQASNTSSITAANDVSAIVDKAMPSVVAIQQDGL